MKFFVCLLSVYILMLISIPCIDRPDEDHIVQTENASTCNHHHHEGNQCSPFCTCNCCGTPAIYQDFRITFDGYSYVEKSFFNNYKSAVISCHHSSIWQPPQQV